MKDDLKEFNEWVNKEETCVSSEILKKYFNLQRPTDILRLLYNTNDKRKNSTLVLNKNRIKQ